MQTQYKTCKNQGQRSVGSKDREETNGRMEAIALPPVLTRSVTSKWTGGQTDRQTDSTDRTYRTGYAVAQ